MSDAGKLGFFSRTVSEAEGKLLDLAGRTGARVRQVRHPLPGPDGDPLHLSLVAVGEPSAAKALVIYSGVHGVEGFAGSALQLALLDEVARGERALGEMVLILVHLVNPWGAAWNRREDHENVDVFRNLIYWDRPVAPHPLFDLVDDGFHWEEWRTQDPEDVRRRLDALAAEHGFDHLLEAIRRGQHHRPKAMGYHGQGRCWSTAVLERELPPLLDGARRIGVIDVHTGFGPPGFGTVMSYDGVESAKHHRVARWVEQPLFVPGSDPNIPPHLDLPFNYLERQVPGSEVTALILEFGTERPERSRETFPDNHFAHVFGDPTSEWAREVAARYRRFLYIEEDGWKAEVLRNGLGVIGKVIGGLTGWGRV